MVNYTTNPNNVQPFLTDVDSSSKQCLGIYPVSYTHLYRLHEGQLRPGYDIVVVARVKAASATYRQLERSFLSLAAKLGLKAREAGEP